MQFLWNDWMMVQDFTKTDELDKKFLQYLEVCLLQEELIWLNNLSYG